MIRATLVLATIVLVAADLRAADEKTDFSPGWLPLNRLDDGPVWSEFRKIDDKIHLYLPKDVSVVRGIYVCFVFHSSDPRELARLWEFALVTVPWPFEFDLGVNDKRNGRYKLGHPVGNMGVLLRYLETAAKETKHPELAAAPLIGWLGQNGSHLGADLLTRVPDRVIAWADSFPNRLEQFPKLSAGVPFPFAWEFTAKDEKDRKAEREAVLPKIKDQLTPPGDLKCRANTYGFGHGIYSKYNFFAAYLDRCIRLRLPADVPPAGQPTRLKPIMKESGWAADFNEVSEWVAIAPVKEAKGMVSPMWLPDEYAAWMYRAYHSAKPDVKLTGPVKEYQRINGKWGGPECGLGYGGSVSAGKPLAFAAEAKGDYAKIEFHDGDRIVATADKAPWQTDGVKLERGLHALFAVGVAKDGTRRASHPGFLLVE